MRSASEAACASARRSIQIIEGRSGRQASSHTTIPSSCDPKDSAPIAAAPPGQAATRRRHARSTAAVHRSGSCSAQPGCGKERS